MLDLDFIQKDTHSVRSTYYEHSQNFFSDVLRVYKQVDPNVPVVKTPTNRVVSAMQSNPIFGKTIILWEPLEDFTSESETLKILVKIQKMLTEKTNKHVVFISVRNDHKKFDAFSTPTINGVLADIAKKTRHLTEPSYTSKTGLSSIQAHLEITYEHLKLVENREDMLSILQTKAKKSKLSLNAFLKLFDVAFFTCVLERTFDSKLFKSMNEEPEASKFFELTLSMGKMIQSRFKETAQFFEIVDQTYHRGKLEPRQMMHRLYASLQDLFLVQPNLGSTASQTMSRFKYQSLSAFQSLPLDSMIKLMSTLNEHEPKLITGSFIISFRAMLEKLTSTGS